MRFLVIGLLLVALTGCSTTYGKINNMDKDGGLCDARIISIKSPWDDKKIDFAGVCGSSAQGTSMANVEAAALFLESAGAVVNELLAP